MSLSVPESKGPFGDRLRTVRRERDLSQGELGGDQYSASYISHLESGRRLPTAAVIEFLAARLGVPAAQLAGLETQEDLDELRTAQATAAELQIQDARVRREYARIILSTEKPPDPARGKADAWWTATYARAEALLADADYEPCLAEIMKLLEHPLSNASAELRARALVFASRALRASGRLQEALSYASAAVTAAGDCDAPEQLVEALRVEVGACAELGLTDRARDASAALANAAQNIRPGHLSGLTSWTLGNIAFLDHDVAEGIRQHTYAQQHLSPDADLRLWARFHGASATMRLQAGTDEGVDDLIEAAGHALALVGNPTDLSELDLLRARRCWQTDPATAISLIDRAIEHKELPGQIRAEAHLLRSEALSVIDPDGLAFRDAILAAARGFEDVGAHERASALWRELAGFGDRGQRIAGENAG